MVRPIVRLTFKASPPRSQYIPLVKMSDNATKTKSEAQPAAHPHPDDPKNVRYTGSCKWFNVVKGFGFIIMDGAEEDVFVHQSELLMEGFRSLEQGERVAFFIRDRQGGKGQEAWKVQAEEEGQQLQGSSIRPLGKKKDTLIRCYKCGKFGSHMAQRCRKIETSEKVCYHCNATDHLFSTCPKRPPMKPRKTFVEGGSAAGSASPAVTSE